MTREQLYDFALEHGVKEPAVLVVMDRAVLGEWVALSMISNDDIIVRSNARGIRVIAATSLNSKDPWGSIASALAMSKRGRG